MIKRIRKLKAFGIFKDFNGDGVQEFGKLNLVYGWNGSGKSTLSTLFESLERRSNLRADIDQSCEFTVALENGSSITEKTVAQATIPIRTFNAGFIKENIDWDNSVKSILLVAKEKIEERKRLEKLKTDQESDDANLVKSNAEADKAGADLQKFLTDSAKRTKTSLQVIGTEDNHYLNYNRTKLEAFINGNSEAVRATSSILKDGELLELVVAAKPETKPQVGSIPNKLNADVFEAAKLRLEGLLKTTATSVVLDRLKDNPDIQQWVQQGLGIHTAHSSDSCEFCGGTLDKSRLEAINAHFSDEYKKFQTRLANAELWLDQQIIEIGDTAYEDLLYEEMRAEFSTAKSELSTRTATINRCIDHWRALLRQKIENQFRTDFDVTPVDSSACDGFRSALAAMNESIARHNRKTNDFAKETGAAKEKIELHYAATEVKAFSYFTKVAKRVAIEKEASQLQTNIAARRQEIQRLEAVLSNEALGADEFNKHLHNFLGRSDLCLHFSPKLFGYEIIRGAEGKHAKNLSEGEKTAIAFVYFITKLAEADQKITNMIIAIDDPISSFDSNHLFHAYAFLRNHCENACQLFVLTHNFNFFKLIRDWFDGTNANRKKKEKPAVAFFYIVEATSEIPRTSSIKLAPSSLHDYNSEYHYIFHRLYQYSEKSGIDRDEAFLAANLARKILESFFSFKYPRHKGDMSELFRLGLMGCTITTPQTKEKIYRFINKYSHSAIIEVGEDSSENLIGESGNIIGDIFTWMKEVDKIHYEQMVETAEVST